MSQDAATPTPRKRTRSTVKKPSNPSVTSDAFDNRQLNLFQNFLANTASERDQLSNTIALWDSIPRYGISRNHQSKLRNTSGTLELLRLPFRHNQIDYMATITPARVEVRFGPDKGKAVEFYPSVSEELIEDALRKMAADQQQGFFDKKGFLSGVAFSLHQLREELAKYGHTRSYHEIELSLEILHKTNIKITCEDAQVEHIQSSTYLPSLAAARRKDIEADSNAKWIVQFHPLVTRSIDTVTYRQYNYSQTMNHRNQLARWLHKQLVMKFTFAAVGTTFKMKFSTIERDSALLTGYKQTRQAVIAVAGAFDELKAAGVLISAERSNEARGLRNKLLDVEFVLTPSPQFVREVKAANKRAQLANVSNPNVALS